MTSRAVMGVAIILLAAVIFVAPLFGVTINISSSGVFIGSEEGLNFNTSTAINWTVTDDPSNNRVNITPYLDIDYLLRQDCTPGQWLTATTTGEWICTGP